MEIKQNSNEDEHTFHKVNQMKSAHTQRENKLSPCYVNQQYHFSYQNEKILLGNRVLLAV